MQGTKRVLGAFLLLLLAVAPLAVDAQTVTSFQGSGRTADGLQLSIVAENLDSGRQHTTLGLVVIDDRPVVLDCARAERVVSRFAPLPGLDENPVPAFELEASGSDGDGNFYRIRIVDRALADSVGFKVSPDRPVAGLDDCGIGRVTTRPVEAGNFTAVVLPPDDFQAQGPDAIQPVPSLRLLTYNVAFLYLEASTSGPPPPVPPCAHCDPLEAPTAPCACWPEITLWPNHYRFANLDDLDRARHLADRILATEQDVVVLNEVFNPAVEEVFVERLADNGPYDHYVKALAGPPIVELDSISDVVEFFVGDVPDYLEVMHPDVSGLTSFRPFPGTSGLMLFSKYPFLPLLGTDVVNDASCGDAFCRAEGWSQGAPLQPGFFSFDVFEHCAETTADCLASKGVGLVKIATPGRPSYIAFTHMQADYPGAQSGGLHPDVRARQLETIRDVIVGAIPASEISSALVYLAGDLNVEGRPRDFPPSTNDEWRAVFDPDWAPGNVADGFFACGNGIVGPGGTEGCRFGENGSRMLRDAWGFETSTTDPGITNENDRMRLDFILHSGGEPPPTGPVQLGPTPAGRCMQHAMIAWDLQGDPSGKDALTWLSDHLPVRGDFGTVAPWCSPNDDPSAALPTRNVRELVFGPTSCGASGPNPVCDQDELIAPPEALLSSPGAFQWFRVSIPGTYWVRVDGRASFHLYHHTDLSRPIEPFEERVGERGILYSLPEPPYYIRTFAVDPGGLPDRFASNVPYTLVVHQNLCRSPEDACILEAGLARDAPYEYHWPVTVDLLSDVRELWWRFKTSGVRKGKVAAGSAGVTFPTVKMQLEAFDATGYQCLTSVAPTIQRWDDHLHPLTLEEEHDFVSSEIDPSDHDWDDDGLTDELRQAPDLPGFQDGEFQVYFVKVTRNSDWQDGFNLCNSNLTTYVSYLTDLTYIVPTELRMWAELDDDLGAQDDLRIHMGWDASGFGSNPPPSESSEVALEQPSSGSTSVGLNGSAHEVIRGYYTRAVWPLLWEIDEGKSLRPWDPHGTFDGIPLLSPWNVSSPRKGSGVRKFLQYSDDSNADDADYYYYLYYARCHIETEQGCS